MSDLEITTAIACFALVLSLFGFFIGSIYNSKQIEKLNDRITRELSTYNQQLRIVNNSFIGNDPKLFAQRISYLETQIAIFRAAINKLARHTEYPKSNIV